MSATLPRTNTTMAAVSDDEAMLGVFERLALDAGREVMRVFHEGCAVDSKADSSPVTEADRESEKIILAGLRAAYPDIPCVAEEEVAAGVATPDLDGAFFLIDPLDGTKEFVNRRTDFTVNIALVRHGVPEVGVVYAPCTGRFFTGRPGTQVSSSACAISAIVAVQPFSASPCSAGSASRRRLRCSSPCTISIDVGPTNGSSSSAPPPPWRTSGGAA